MSSRTLEDEEERLRQKLKRKAEERKSNGSSQIIAETERMSDSNDLNYPCHSRDGSLESNKIESNTEKLDRLENTTESIKDKGQDKKPKRNRDEQDGPTDTRQSLKRNHTSKRPNRDLGSSPPDHSFSDSFYDRRRWENNGGPRDSFGRQPGNYPSGRGGQGPYHDYPPRREERPPFHRGGPPRMEYGARYREDERPPFRGEGPRGDYYPPNNRMNDFPSREPFRNEYDRGYRGDTPPGPPTRRESPANSRGMDDSKTRRSSNSRRPSVTSSCDRSDRSHDSRSRSSNRSSDRSRSVSSSDRSSDYSDSDRDSSSASSYRDRKNTMGSSDHNSRRPKPRDIENRPKGNVRVNDQDNFENHIPKEKRTIFVSQLVMRVNEDDLYKFFRSECGCKVVDVILLRDKRTGRHKGCAYIELARLEDIPRTMEWNDKPPPFQRFPIAIKAPDLSFLTTDATAAYLVGLAEGNEKAAEILTESVMQSSTLMGSSNALNVYVGNIDRNVTQPQLQAIFSQFGELEKVSLQVDVATGISKGFAFFGFRDPKVANLCIQVMSGQMIAGRPLRTGWANSKNDQSMVSTEFPSNVAQRIRMVDEVLVRLNGTGLSPIHGFDWSKLISSQEGNDFQEKSSLNGILPAAELAINAALGVSNNVTDVGKSISSLLEPTVIGNNDKPTSCILVHNMFDKDQETDAGWEEDIEAEFAEECGKYGRLRKIRVMSEEVGGKIYALFETVEGAMATAKCLAGRWFDKRQLRVDFVAEDILK